MKNNLICLIYTILTFLSLNPYISIYIEDIALIYILNIILFCLLFIFYKKLYKEDIKLEKKYIILDIIISFIFVLFYSYEINSNASLMFGSIKNFIISIIKLCGFYYFIKIFMYYFDMFLKKDYKSNNKLVSKFAMHPFKYSFIFLSICYGILLILYYPGILNYDNANQIKEVFGLHTRYIDAIIPVSNSMLTNFNPILHTILLGGLTKIGYLLGNINIGIFMYTLFQLFIVICTYSYVLSYSIKKGTNKLITFIILLVLGFIPLFGYYSITAVKDTLYVTFLLLFSIELYDIVNKKDINIRDHIDLFLISLLISLFRNNGIFIVVVCIPFIIYKDKKFLLNLFTILLVYFSIVKIIVPACGVSGTSIREIFSIPFQQTARLVKYKNKEIDNNDKEVISKILDYKNLAKDYNEDLADPVKNKFNKYSSKKDLVNYIIVWGKYFVKYPDIYIDAMINNITSYFYPFENSWKIYHKLNRKLPEAHFDYHYNKLDELREYMHNYEILIEVSPIGLILNIGVLSWFSIYIFIKSIKKKEYIFLIPNIISIMFCLLSPANTYYRYIYPTLVLMVCMFPLIKKNFERAK